jgi:HEAT repeat protein
MNWKRLLVMVVVIGLGLGVYWWKGEELYRMVRPLPHYQDRLLNSLADLKKLPSLPPAMTSQEDLETLVKRIASLNFPECDQVRDPKEAKCDDLKFRQGFQLCMERVEYEVGRISQIRDKNLVPGLIRVAQEKKYHYGFLQDKACGKMKAEFLGKVCMMRFMAISTLGEIKDPRAIAPLLKLIDEPIPSFDKPEELEEGCYGPKGPYLGFTCSLALESLIKMGATPKEQGLMPELLKALDQIKDQPTPEINATLYQAAQAGCKVQAASLFRTNSLDVMLEKYQGKGTSEAKKEALLASISQIRDPKAISKLKELMHNYQSDPVHGRRGNLGSSAAEALAGIASPALIPEYKWMLESGWLLYFVPGCQALGKIKDPSTIPYLINLIKENGANGSAIESACHALAKMGPIAREAVPALIDALNNCDDSCQEITSALGAIRDESEVPALLRFALTNPGNGGEEAVYALKAIGSASAVDALKKIIIWEGHMDITSKMSKDQYTDYRLTRNAAVDSLWYLRGEQENSLFCSLQEDSDIYPAHKHNYCKNSSK